MAESVEALKISQLCVDIQADGGILYNNPAYPAIQQLLRSLKTLLDKVV